MRTIRFLSLLLWSLLLSGLLGWPHPAAAQTAPDSTRLSYGEEFLSQPLTIDAGALRVQREDRALWKLGLNNFSPSTGYSRYGLHIAYERKLGRPSWSVLGEISPSMLRRYLGNYYDHHYRWSFNTRAQLASRYYYNLEHRIRQGHSAGNFSANYLSIALGTGIGRYSDTPFGLVVRGGQLLHAEAALLYGVQRRLGRYGFVDANAGLVRRLTSSAEYQGKLSISGSVRVGLVLGGAPVARSYVPEITAGILTPQWYVGTQAGVYGYSLRYRNGYQSFYYGNELAGPYVYVGRYVRPRLAVQVGAQYEHQRVTETFYSTPQGTSRRSNKYTVALPVLLRYTLTKLPQQRVQVDVVTGAALATSWVRYQYLEYVPSQAEPVITDTGRDQGSGVNPMLGLNLSYGFGRARRVQATAEGVLIKPLLSSYYYGLSSGVSVGLRYRFKYQ